jgi:translation initiation factor 1
VAFDLLIEKNIPAVVNKIVRDLKVWLIKKFNKPITVVRGLEEIKDVQSITRDLKTKLGTGGTYKDGQIILQGDHRESVKNFLIAKGFKQESIEVM